MQYFQCFKQLSGGRMTKVAGRAASYAPSFGAVALGATLMVGATGQVMAANECGVAIAGGTITCDGDGTPATDVDPYASGIFYSVGGITLNVNGAANAITTTTDHGVHVLATDANDIVINTSDATPVVINTSGLNHRGIFGEHSGTGAVSIVSAGDITTDGNNAYAVVGLIDNTGNTETISIDMTGGLITTTGSNGRGLVGDHDGLGAINITSAGSINTSGASAYGVYARTQNAGNAEAITINLTATGTITTGGTSAYGMRGQHSGLGAVNVSSAGNITTNGIRAYGLYSQILNTTSIATATALMTGGSVATTWVYASGVYATTTGLGATLAQMDGGTLTTTGAGASVTAAAHGLRSYITSATSTATATALLTAGGIVTTGNYASGISAQTSGLGMTLAQMNGGSITTGIGASGTHAYGLHSYIANASSTATATALLNDGAISTHWSNARGLFAQTDGLGNALTQMEGGSIVTAGNFGLGLYSYVANATSAATATALLNGGDIDTTGSGAHGLYARTDGSSGEALTRMTGGNIDTAGNNARGLYSYVTNTTGTATATAWMTDGAITTTGGMSAYGLQARNNGLGTTLVQMDGGSVTTSAASAYGMYSQITNATSTGAATTWITAGGSVTTAGSSAHGLWSQTNGLGDVLVQVDGGAVTTGGGSAHGLYSGINNTASTATATTLLTAGGSVTTAGSGAYGLSSVTTGLGATLAQMNVGTISTTGANEAHGLSSWIYSATGTATATALLTAGDIVTTGDISHGLNSGTHSLGDALAQMDSGTVTTGGFNSFGLFSPIYNPDSTATATTLLTSGDIVTTGIDAGGLLSATYGLGGGALAQMNGGSITTGGDGSSGLTSLVLDAASTATATALLTGGGIVTTGNNVGLDFFGAHGLYAMTFGLGETLVQMDGGTVTTGGVEAFGLYSRIANATSTATTAALLRGGDIVTTGNGAHGVYVLTIGLGNVVVSTVGTGTISTAGAGANGIQTLQSNAAATGTTTITLGGDIVAGGDGININSLSSGAVLITGEGSITGGSNVGDDGIDVIAQNSVTIDVNGVIIGDPGIIVSSTNGPINIAGAGDVTGNGGNGIDTTITNVAATGDITIARDGVVTGSNNGILAANDGIGNIIITANQVVTGGTGFGINTNTIAGASSTIALNAGAIVSSTSGFGIFNNGGNSTTLVNAGAGVAGEIRLNNGSDNLTFAGGDFSNVTVFDGGDDISVADGFIDILTLNGAGIVNGSNILNWEQFNIGGNIAVTGGTLTAGTTTITSGGTLDAGNNLTLNSHLNILIGGTFNGTGGGAGVYTINGTVTNAGLITTQDGAVGDVVTVAGNYTGGGAINIDTVLGGSGSPTDRIVINGNSSGVTVVNVNNVGGTGGPTGNGATDGIRVIQVDGANNGSFNLGNPVNVGAYNYTLNNYGYLQSVLLAQVYGYSAVQAVLREEVDTLWQRMGQERELLNRDGTTSTLGSGFWMRSSYSSTTAHTKTTVGITNVSNNLDTTRTMTQLGYEQMLFASGNGYLSGGLFGHYKRFDLKVDDFANARLAGAQANGYGGGASLTWNNRQGFYGDLVGQITAYDVSVYGNTGSKGSFDALAYSASIEAGYRFDLDGPARLVPQAQLIWRGSNFDNLIDSSGLVVKWNEQSTITGRIGLALEGGNTIAQGGNGLTGYVVANLLYDFDKSGNLTASGTSVGSQVSRAWGELRLGANLTSADNKHNFFAEAGFTHSLSSQNYSNFKGVAGFKIKF